MAKERTETGEEDEEEEEEEDKGGEEQEGEKAERSMSRRHTQDIPLVIVGRGASEDSIPNNRDTMR